MPASLANLKYGISRTFRVVLDLIFVYFFMRFRTRPGHFFGGIGIGLGAMGGLILVVLLLGAGLRAIFGVASKQTLATTSILIALSAALFLISGNEDSMRGLAWDGPIVVLWRLARLFPTTYAFLAARSLWLTGETAALGRDLGIVLATTFVGMGGAGWLLRRAYSQLPGGQ